MLIRTSGKCRSREPPAEPFMKRPREKASDICLVMNWSRIIIPLCSYRKKKKGL